MNKNKEEAFTLIELLVVISIIALLTSIILTSISTSRQKARDASKISSLQQVRSALQLYYTDHGYYPSDVNADTMDRYIGSIVAGAHYQPKTLAGAICDDDDCPSYVLSIPLERTDNKVTRVDADGEDIENPDTGYEGNCGLGELTGDWSGASSLDLCYEIIP